jgi:hypothetical protein
LVKIENIFDFNQWGTNEGKTKDWLLLLSARPTWQGVSTDSLTFYPVPPCPTLLCPMGGPPLKRPYSCFWGGPSTWWMACGRLVSPWIPHAVRACIVHASEREEQRRNSCLPISKVVKTWTWKWGGHDYQISNCSMPNLSNTSLA